MRKYKRMIFDGTTYIEARYADHLEEERRKDAAIHLQREFELIEEINRLKAERVELIDEIIEKIESMKGLSGKMSMGEWSSKMIDLLEQFKIEKS